MRNLNAWAAKTHADYAIANTVHHLERCFLKNLIKGKERQ